MKTTKSRPKRINKPVFNKFKKCVALFTKHGRVKRMNNDRLEILKKKYEQELLAKQRELQEVKSKLANLRLFEQESAKLINPKSEPDRYVKMGMTQAILDAVERLKNVSVKGSTQSQIRDHIIACGFPLPESPQNFSIAVSTTISRLVESGRLIKTFDEDGNFYLPVKGEKFTMI